MMHSTGVSAALDSLLSQSRDDAKASDKLPTCCCASPQCASLAKNRLILEELDRDVRQAAQIGQALVSRQNAYSTEVEHEKQSIAKAMDSLASDKHSLECSNSKMIEENKYLLAQLELINADLAHSDSQVQTLEATLESTKRDLDKLSSLSAQTTLLEAQLTAMETEQARLHGQVQSKDEETQVAVQRWKAAERTITHLSEQVARIEREHQEEQNRHAEMVARLERRHAVQSELASSTRRPSSSESSTPHKEGTSHNHVVSTFVKEILQDNANLQMGIVELREMLSLSNEEVAHLREQSMHAQSPVTLKREATLKSELQRSQSADKPLHVHHHYHAAPKAAPRKDKAPVVRRPRKKRYASSPGPATPGSGAQTPNLAPSSHSHIPTPSSAAAILSHTTVSIPQERPVDQPYCLSSQRPVPGFYSLSLQTSPSSSYREQSIFDMSENFAELSRPTTPASTSLGSPIMPYAHYKRSSDGSVTSVSNLGSPRNSESFPFGFPSTVRTSESHDTSSGPRTLDRQIILEEPEDEPCISEALHNTDNNGPQQPDLFEVKSRLRRANSAESIFSVHAKPSIQLRSKPSRLLDVTAPSYNAAMASIAPVTSSTAAIGTSSRGSRQLESDRYTRLLLANHSAEVAPLDANKPKASSAFGKRLGGWMIGKWGSAPAASTRKPQHRTSANDLPGSRQGTRRLDEAKAGPETITSQVEALRIDSSLLEEALEAK